MVWATSIAARMSRAETSPLLTKSHRALLTLTGATDASLRVSCRPWSMDELGRSAEAVFAVATVAFRDTRVTTPPPAQYEPPSR